VTYGGYAGDEGYGGNLQVLSFNLKREEKCQQKGRGLSKLKSKNTAPACRGLKI
jgi:hypothetical protein